MSYYYNKGISEGQKEFIVETAAEVSDLPTSTTSGTVASAIGRSYGTVSIGSTALCVETGDVYVLTSNNSWTKVGG